jgi:PAS domain S-box-containing protein
LQRGSNRPYAFIEAATAADGLRAIRSLPRPPDCALIDYHLPDADAHDVLVDCAGQQELAPFPALVLTGSASSDEVREVFRVGAQDCLGKESLTAQSLTRAVENAVARYWMAAGIREREAVILENEARLRLALESSNTGLWTWDLATDRVVWSPEVHVLLGVRGEHFDGTGASFFALVHPEDRARVQASVHEALAHGTLYECEFRILRPDGTTVWVENRGRARRSASGEPQGMLGTVTDIGRRKDMEARLRRSEFELRTITDNIPDLLSRFDRELRHLYVNGAVERATGLSRDAFIGKTNRELGMPSACCDQWDAALRAAFDTGQDQFITFAFEGPSGTQHYEARIVAELGLDGRVDQVIVVTHDVTERERHDQALRDAARRKDEFLATLAHELRNPMAPIRTGIDVLKIAKDQEDRTKTLAAMERQLSHMTRLVEDLMDISRIRRGAIQLERERIELTTIVQPALEASRDQISTSGLELEVSLPEAPIWIDGDRTRLAQVIGNLLSNAAKYTPAGGHIRLAATVDGGDVKISVTDDGIGISAEDLPEIFDLFSQSGASLDRAQGGLGIGLSLVRQLVTLHEGTVDVQSAGNGHGAVFTVRLPLAVGDAAPVVERNAQRSAPPERQEGRRVLVVDDNRDAAELLATMLSLAGNETRVAHDGPAAITAARAFSPHVVFLDLGLPGMDGFDVARRLRSGGATREGLVLVALTGWGSAEDKRRSAEAGFDFHLTKPVQLSEVTDILERSVRSSP